jgi:hypothetical protein
MVLSTVSKLNESERDLLGRFILAHSDRWMRSSTTASRLSTRWLGQDLGLLDLPPLPRKKCWSFMIKYRFEVTYSICLIIYWSSVWLRAWVGHTESEWTLSLYGVWETTATESCSLRRKAAHYYLFQLFKIQILLS